MPKKKDPMTRYLLLDECFRNKHGHFRFYDLFHFVNRKLREKDLEEVSERTLHEDIRNMQRDDVGFGIELAHDFDGRERIYHYEDMDYSILSRPLTQSQAEMLTKTIEMLSHLRGMPNYEWLDQTLVLLRQQFELGKTSPDYVHFSQCEKLIGLSFFTPLYEALRNERVLEITYHRFGQPSRKRVVHPYMLKQYNNRWYLIGLEERLLPRHKYAVLALDRIEKVKELDGVKLLPVNRDELNRYYADIVGVSRLPEGRICEVRVKAYYPAAHYLETKPLHKSQKVVDAVPGVQGYKVFKWLVLENEELVQQLLVYADQIEVLEGEWVKAKIKERAQKMLEMMDKT